MLFFERTNSMLNIKPTILTGQKVRLEPLQPAHAADLFQATQEDPDLWKYMLAGQPRSLAEMERLIAVTLHDQEAGVCLPFAIIDRARGNAVGETRFLNIQPQDRGLEIGSTWLAPSVQRTGTNTECKYLLLSHAFEDLGAIRVQLKTHHLNLRSQRAIERLGAVKEGTLRNHMIMPDGSYRHSVYYSIIADEWPRVKARLAASMQSYA